MRAMTAGGSKVIFLMRPRRRLTAAEAPKAVARARAMEAVPG